MTIIDSLIVYYSKNIINLSTTSIGIHLSIYIEHRIYDLNNYRAHTQTFSLCSMCFFFSVLITLCLGNCWNFRMKFSFSRNLEKKRVVMFFHFSTRMKYQGAQIILYMICMKKSSTHLKCYNSMINCCRAQQCCQKVKIANGSKIFSKTLYKSKQC